MERESNLYKTNKKFKHKNVRIIKKLQFDGVGLKPFLLYHDYKYMRVTNV